MKTQVALNTFQGVLARDRLKKTSAQRFTVLYDLLLYLVVPVAFELSYVKVVQRSLHAYETNDALAMSRLIVYLLIQSFLGLLVHKKYVKPCLKKITLALLILLQLKEAFLRRYCLIWLFLWYLSQVGPCLLLLSSVICLYI